MSEASRETEASDEDGLCHVLTGYGLELPDEQARRLQQYCQLLWEWNRKTNLTRHTDYDTFVRRDVLDAWQLVQLLPRGQHVLDVGSGGGVPGVVLAILRSDLKVTLCESVGKKAKALAAMVEQLGLPIAVLNQRVQEVLSTGRFDTLVARAIGPLETILPWFSPYGSSFQRVLLIKGPGWVEERARARHRGLLRAWELRRVARYRCPGREAENVVLALWLKDRSSAPGSSANSIE